MMKPQDITLRWVAEEAFLEVGRFNEYLKHFIESYSQAWDNKELNHSKKTSTASRMNLTIGDISLSVPSLEAGLKAE